MFCRMCGSEIQEGDMFCTVCGTSVSREMPGQGAQQMGYAQQNGQNRPGMINAISGAPVEPSSGKAAARKHAGSKRLPMWGKILILVVGLMAVAGGVLLALNQKKNDKKTLSGGKGTFSVDGTTCELNPEEGIAGLGKVPNGITVLLTMRKSTYYHNGEFSAESSDDCKVSIQGHGAWSEPYKNDNLKIGCLQVKLIGDFQLSDGTGIGSTIDELEKAGYAGYGGNDHMGWYYKLFDANGEIPLETIDSEYERFLEGGPNALDFSVLSGRKNMGIIADAFTLKNEVSGEDRIRSFKEGLETISGEKPRNAENYLKFCLLEGREWSRLTGLKREMDESGEGSMVYYGSENDYLVRWDYWVDEGEVVVAELNIYAPMNKLNDYIDGWFAETKDESMLSRFRFNDNTDQNEDEEE